MLLMFSSGAFRGPAMLSLRHHRPDGHVTEEDAGELQFDPQGVNSVVQLTMGLGNPGRHWFDVLLSGRLVTRIALEIVHTLPVEDAPGSTAGPASPASPESAE